MGNPEEHSLYSPSQAERIFNCPGSVQLTSEAEKQGLAPRESAYAEEGTLAHHLLAQLLVNEVDISGKPPVEKSLQVSEDMYDHIQQVVDWLVGLFDADEANIYVEEKVAIPGLEKASGTSDVVIVSKDRSWMRVFDLKYGAGRMVSAIKNNQLMQYASNLSHHFNLQNNAKVTLTIIQPRTWNNNWHNSWEVPVTDLLDHTLKMASMIADGDNGKGYLQYGDWCTFCPAAIVCPVAQEIVELTTGKRLKEIDDVPSILTEISRQEDRTPDPAAITRISETLKAAPYIKKWLTKVETIALDLLMEGHKIPGFKAVTAKGIRKWDSDTESIVSAIQTWYPYLRKDELIRTQPLPITQMEQLVKKSAREMHHPPNEASKKASERLATLMVKKSSGKPTLADESDPRPAININHFKQTKVTK